MSCACFSSDYVLAEDVSHTDSMELQRPACVRMCTAEGDRGPGDLIHQFGYLPVRSLRPSFVGFSDFVPSTCAQPMIDLRFKSCVCCSWKSSHPATRKVAEGQQRIPALFVLRVKIIGSECPLHRRLDTAGNTVYV
jgi:hypothetical protein